MKKGFTLAELLGVIVLISILIIISVPTVINQIRKNVIKADAVVMVILEDATNEYMRNNETIYPFNNNSDYCISLQQLADGNKISPPIINPSTNATIPLNYSMRVQIGDKGNAEITYTLVENC
jgi:prepilin-type N-terminal cleavage/methylation domain-containing protein